MAAVASVDIPSRCCRATALGETAAEAGHAVLLPDSYGSRELGPHAAFKERHVLARASGGRHHRGAAMAFATALGAHDRSA